MTAVSNAYAQRLVFTLFLVSLGIYLFLATVTYTPFDPGWMHISSETKEVSNASGVVGAWFSDLLFGFIGWASLLIPVYLFIEAIQIWWPHSFLNRIYRYTAQFFIILVTSSLLYIFLSTPSDTLQNASGGIIGYEIGQSLINLLTIWGAGFVLIVFELLLVTLAFGIRWNRTWATLKATPAYLQELFYRNTPSNQSDFDRTLATQTTHKTPSDTTEQAIADHTLHADAQQQSEDKAIFIDVEPKLASEVTQSESKSNDTVAERLFQELANKELEDESVSIERASTLQEHNAQSFEKHTHVNEQATDTKPMTATKEAESAPLDNSQRLVASGEVWRALQSNDHHHKQDIDALLKAADDVAEKESIQHRTIENEPVKQQHSDFNDQDTIFNTQHVMHENTDQHQSLTNTSHSQVIPSQKKEPVLDWENDAVFNELLAELPKEQFDYSKDTATKVDVEDDFIQNLDRNINLSHDDVRSEQSNASFLVDDELKIDEEHFIYSAEQNGTVLKGKEPTEIVNIDDIFIEESVVDTKADTKAINNQTASTQTAQSQAFASQATQRPSVTDDHQFNKSHSQPTENRHQPVESIQRAHTQNKEHFDIEDALEDDFFDAPLTDRAGRPMSRAMQVVERRKDLPTLPGLELLDKVDPNKKVNFTAEQLSRLSELLEIKLQEFNVKAKVIEAQPGPVVTRFELDLAPGVKASKVTNISRDLARSMSMASVRVVEVIPGKPYIGIEVPNSAREMVRLIELLDTPTYRDPEALISMAMGKDISGKPVLTDLAKAPHMLVAGTTGSGKSVAVNAMLLSMLLKYTPNQLRLILIDPKQLELANYNDIPHLLTPVVTDMKDAVSALNWCVNEMERRYKLMSFLKIRKISDYNRKVEQALANGEDLIDPTWKPSDSATQDRAPRLTPLPMIVIVADEFADMIMQVGKKAEEMITRLAQKSRAAGIHLLLATQRPSVDVITGLIKANIPTRAALRVNSKIDSRTILDAGGAEDLLGHGDMLFLGPGKIEPERVHGAFISDDEVNRICDAWRERSGPNYIDEILTPFDEEPTSRGFEEGEGAPDRDMLYDQCVAFVLETRKVTASSLQRKFSLGYNRAARIVDQMEENGIVSPQGANGKREILV